MAAFILVEMNQTVDLNITKMLGMNKYFIHAHLLISSVSLAHFHYIHRQRKNDRWHINARKLSNNVVNNRGSVA